MLKKGQVTLSYLHMTVDNNSRRNNLDKDSDCYYHRAR